MNVFTFTGNLGRDIKTAFTATGVKVGHFSVAVTSGYGKNKVTTWVDCSLFGEKQVDGLSEYLTKGTKVAVSGEFSMNTYTTRDGEEKTTPQVRVNSVTLLGNNEPRDNNHAEQHHVSEASQYRYDDLDDDVAF